MSDQGAAPLPQYPSGGQPPGGYPPYVAPRNHPSAVTSLVLGIVSLVMCGLFTGIPAMITGRRVVRETRASNGALGGEGLGQAGFWTGLVGTVISGATLLLVVGVFALGGVISGTFENTCTTVGNGPPSSC